MGFWDWLLRRKDRSDPLSEVSFALPAPVVSPPHVSNEPQPPAYGIENAIELMRTLPIDDEPELVLRVVRKTLQSTGISVEQIIDSAKHRESTLSASADAQRDAIAQLEREIFTRRGNIQRTEAQLTETRSARERLEEALQNETKVGPRLAQEAARLHADARDAMSAVSASSKTAQRPAEATSEPLGAPVSQSPSAPKSASAPRSATGITEVRKKLAARKLLERTPPEAATSEGPPIASGKRGLPRPPNAEPAAPAVDTSSSLPSLSDDLDELTDEPTRRWIGAPPDVASRKR